jgi:hypothetical protein
MELGFRMTHLLRLAVLGFVLVSAAPGAWAANPLPLIDSTGNSVSGSLVWFGFTVTATCTEGVNGAAATACTAGQHLELEAVPSGRDTVTFEIVNTTPISAILAAPAGKNTGKSLLNVALTFTAVTTYKATSASTTALGYQNYSKCGTCGGDSATASAIFAAAAGTVPSAALIDTLPLQTDAVTTPTLLSASALSPAFASNSFTVTDTLTLTSSVDAVRRLEFDSLALKLTTTPEPSSIAVVLAGIAAS